MTATSVDRTYPWAIHPIHAVLVAGTIPLFLGAMLSDITYSRTYEIQWTNFASWLIAGGLLFAGLALLWAVIDLVRAEHRSGRPLLYVVVLLATWVVGFFNALIHAKDGWGAMPMGLVLSVAVVLLAGAATWLGIATLRVGDAR